MQAEPGLTTPALFMPSKFSRIGFVGDSVNRGNLPYIRNSL